MIIDRSARSFKSMKTGGPSKYITVIRFTAADDMSLSKGTLTIKIHSGGFGRKTIKLNVEETANLKDILNR